MASIFLLVPADAGTPLFARVPIQAGSSLSHRRSQTTAIELLASSDRRRVLDAALGPEPVQAAADAELGACADIAVEDLTVVADLLHDAHHPVLAQAELFSEIALDAEQPADFRL